MDSRLEHRSVCLIRHATTVHGISYLREFTAPVIVTMRVPMWHKHRMKCNDCYDGVRESSRAEPRGNEVCNVRHRDEKSESEEIRGCLQKKRSMTAP